MNIPMNNFFTFLTTKTNETANDRITIAVTSLLFLFMGCIFLKHGFRALYCIVKGDKVNAVINHIETHRTSSHSLYNSLKVYVTYTYNGNYYPNIHVANCIGYKGQTVTVYVSPARPNKPTVSRNIIAFPAGLGVTLFAIHMLMSIAF